MGLSPALNERSSPCDSTRGRGHEPALVVPRACVMCVNRQLMRELPTSSGRPLLRSVWQMMLICWVVARLFGASVAADQLPTPPAAPPPGESDVDECAHREAI